MYTPIRRVCAPMLLLVVASCCVVATPPCWAQQKLVIVLPPTRSGTALSAQIQAEAQYLLTRGELAKSVAVARRIHADAVAQEIQNSVDYVDAYFRRKALNRKYRAETNPNHLQREIKQQSVRELQLKDLPEEFLNSDVTEKLNWLLAELSGPTLALQYVAGQVSVVDSETGPKVSGQYMAGQIQLDDFESGRELTKEDTALIQFSDGRVTFSAADNQMLKTKWPWALRAPQFDVARRQFQSAREQVLTEIKSDGEVKYESGERMMKALNDLLVELKRAYPQDKLKERDTVLQYITAKRYLASLTAEATATLQGMDHSMFNGSLGFTDGSVIDLIRHMDGKGLVFAPPSPEGQRVYRSLLSEMRSLYSVLSD